MRFPGDDQKLPSRENSTRPSLYIEVHDDPKFLAEAPDEESMAFGTIKTDSVNRSSAFRGIDDLANSQHRGSGGHVEQIRDIGVRHGCVDFFVSIGQIHSIIMLENGK